MHFLSRTNRLLSSSKDGLLKLWDLDTQHCLQNLVGHRHEVPDRPLGQRGALDEGVERR